MLKRELSNLAFFADDPEIRRRATMALATSDAVYRRGVFAAVD